MTIFCNVQKSYVCKLVNYGKMFDSLLKMEKGIGCVCKLLKYIWLWWNLQTRRYVCKLFIYGKDSKICWNIKERTWICKLVKKWKEIWHFINYPFETKGWLSMAEDYFQTGKLSFYLWHVPFCASFVQVKSKKLF